MRTILKHGLFALIAAISTVIATILTIHMIIGRYIPISPLNLFSIDLYLDILVNPSPGVSFRLFWGIILWGLLFFAIFFPSFRRLLLRLFSPFKELIKLMGAFCREYKAVLIAAVVLLVLCFGFKIVNPTLSIDEELAMSGMEGDTVPLWLAQGRLGISLFKAFFQYHNILPLFVSSFLSAILWTISGLTWCVVLFYKKETSKRLSPLPLIVFLGLFMSMPSIIPNFMIFGTYNIEVCLAMIFSAFSIFCIMRYNVDKQKVYFVASLFPLAFAISVYQSFISVFITGSVAALLSILVHSYCPADNKSPENSLDNKGFSKWLRMVLTYIVALIISIAGYYAFLYISFAITSVQASPYANIFIGWGRGTPITTLVYTIIHQIYTLFFAPGMIGALGIRLTIIALIIVSVLGIICYKGWKRFLIPVMCVLLGLSPFSLVLALMGFLPLRSMQAMPLMMGIAWCFMFIIIRQLTIRKAAVIVPYIIAASLVFGQIQTLNQIFYGDHMRFELDRRLAAMIMYDVKQEFGCIPDAPFMFLGVHYHPPNPAVFHQSEAVGASFWSWDNGNNWRITAFLQMEGYNVRPVTYQKGEMEALYRDQMPIWPQNGSIIETEHGIMVRLS